LQDHFTLIAPDMLGHGFSDKPPNGDYSVEAHAVMHDALLAQLGVDECHIVAFDLGVSVAQEMLARRIEQPKHNWPAIRSLVFLNGGLCPQAYQPRLIQRLLVSPIGGWLAARINQRTFEKPITRMYGNSPPPSKALLEDFWYFVNHADGRKVAHRVGAFWKARMAQSDRLVGALLHNDVRLRLINGASDPNSGAHMVRAFLKHQPNADVVSLKALGHWPQLQDPETVAKHMLEFFLTA
jgi:pimeloyl-ACP methyl ester carboxylesterase